MRIKNKEIRQRRHRKEQKIKEASRILKQELANRPVAAAAPVAPKPKKEPKPKAVKAEAAEKPKAPRKKKEEAGAE